jgi:DNA-directed RNA polymerase specialized sigma subunit
VSSKARPWIEVAASRAKRLAETRESVVTREQEVAEAIRSALAEGSSATAIAEAVGISRARVYQIRDGRR